MPHLCYDRWNLVMPVLRGDRTSGPRPYPDILRGEIEALDVRFSRSRHVLVTCDSPDSHKHAVEQLAFYFRRETGWSTVGYEASDCGHHPDAQTRALLWVDVHKDEFPAYGAACFRWRTWNNLTDACWSLQWVWLHPYARGRDGLGKTWPLLGSMFGPFTVEPPYSSTTRRFLERQPYRSVPTTNGDEARLFGVSPDEAPGGG